MTIDNFYGFTKTRELLLEEDFQGLQGVECPLIQNRQWLGYFCALRSGGKRSIVSLCEHLRRQQGAKRANQNDFLN